jgi:ABC-type transporter Mla subunit MlaD
MSEPQQRRRFDPGSALGWLPLVGGVLLGGWFLVVAWNQQAWLHRSFSVRFRTADASGLWPGVHVTLAGYRIGRVERVRLEEDGLVGVELRIAETYRRLIGPRSRAWRYQEGLIGPSQVGLSADATPAGSTPAPGDRRVDFEAGPDVAQLLKELGQTRVKLNRTLESTARLAEKELPVAIAGFKRTLKDVRRLGDQVEREATLTGSATRRTLGIYARTGENLGEATQQATRTGEEGLRALRVTQPALLETLKEVRNLSRRTNQLLDGLGVSPAREP